MRNTYADTSRIQEEWGLKVSYPVSSITSCIEQASEEQKAVIESSSQKVRESIENSTSTVCGTLDHGFGMLTDGIKGLDTTMQTGFGAVVSGLGAIQSTLSWGFSKLIEIQKQTNIHLNDIVQLLHIPDSEKDRKLYIERGLEFLQKTTIDEVFYPDSLNYFQKALELEKNDYYVLYNLGLIHFFSKDCLDLAKASDFFLKSAQYAYADMAYKKVDYAVHASSFKNTINPKTIAIYSYLYAARCEYLMNDFKRALELSEKSYSLGSEILEVAFDKAKYLAVNDKITQAIPILDTIIKKDRYITFKILKDKDLIPRPEVQELLERFKRDAVGKASRIIKECQSIIQSDSSHTPELQKAIAYLNKLNFLDSMSALDTLNK